MKAAMLAAVLALTAASAQAQSEDPHERRASGGMDMIWPPVKREPTQDQAAPPERAPPEQQAKPAPYQPDAPLAQKPPNGENAQAVDRPAPVIPGLTRDDSRKR